MDADDLIIFSIVVNRKGEYFAFMDERLIYSMRFMYFMDETGNHDFVNELYMHDYRSIGKISTCKNANDICRLLQEMNKKPSNPKLLMYHFKNSQ